MLDGIAGARRTVDPLTFVYWRGEIGARFAEALCDRARAGVRVRVLLSLTSVLSALLAVLLWPLILFGANLHIK